MNDEADVIATLVERFFGPDAPSRTLATGEVLMRAGESNSRLYYIRSGSFRLRSERRTEVRLGPGHLIGVQSLFLRRFVSVWTDIADEPSEVAWIDLAQPGPEGQPWEVVLMPLVVAELNHRQQRVRDMEEQQHRTEQRLQELGYITTLGQMAAGVAHELNNALAVLARGTDWIRGAIDGLVGERQDWHRELLRLGLERGHARGDGDLAARARRLRRAGLGFGPARHLAALPLDDQQLDRLADDPERERALAYYELGATLADMGLSATQGSHVVSSLKQLAASERVGLQEVDLESTLEIARSICRNSLKGITLEIDSGEGSHVVQGNQGELVQVWTNLIQNACEALHTAGIAAPRIRIVLRDDDGHSVASVADNGPGIDPAVADDIFMPHVSTKRDDHHVGLGLGLSIVRQIVRRYGGSVAAGPTEGGGATFTLRLPHRIGETTRWVMKRSSSQYLPRVRKEEA